MASSVLRITLSCHASPSSTSPRSSSIAMQYPTTARSRFCSPHPRPQSFQSISRKKEEKKKKRKEGG
eukprot:711292-Rhodomonas_salina.1